MIARREFLVSLGTTALAAPLALRSAFGAEGYPSTAYSRGMIIDALGGPGDFDPGAADDAPLSARALADVKSSGLTAVNVTVGAVGNGAGKFAETIQSIALTEREITAHPDILMQVHTARDLQVAKASGRLGLIFGFQDTSMLEGDLTRLALFQNLGVRIVQPTYNRRNLMGDGCIEPADGGLSLLGHELIAEINRLNLLLDLSHAGPRTIAEGIVASRSPMAITHTGCRALVDVPRNTYDRELKALADKGGVVGIYFMPFLRASGQPHAQDLIRHLEHAVGVCGEEHVGLGTDGTLSGIPLGAAYAERQRKFYEERKKAGISAPGEAPDVFNLIPEYNDPRRFKTLADDLSRRGWPASRIEKVLGANFARLFKDAWKS